MKTLVSLLSALLMCPIIHAQESHVVKILDIAVTDQQTPEFQVSGPKAKKTKPRDWIEIEAEIEVKTINESGFIPELTAHWHAMTKDTHAKDPKNALVRLSGKSSYKNIRCADGKVFISAYIEPDTIERLSGKSKLDIKAVALVISGPNIRTDKEYGKGLSKATANEGSEWWMSSKYKSLDEMIVAKSKTPFAPLWTDRYPTEKSSDR